MANVFVNEDSLSDIADAIRDKLRVQTTYKPGEMAAAIQSISGGGITPTGTKSITANGTYDVTSYASADVNVPSGGATLQAKTNINPTTASQTITADSGYDGLSSVQINAMPSQALPSSTSASGTGTQKATIGKSTSSQYLNIPTGYNDTAQYYNILPMDLQSLNVTENGTYNASTYDLDGFSSVTVNVSGGGGVQSASGTFTGSGNATQDINCSFAPDIIKIYRSDIASRTAVADRCLATLYIAKDGAYSATYTGVNATSLSNAGHGIKEATPAWTSDYNISSTLYATYSNGVLTVGSGNGQRYSSSLTYNYELIKYTS